MEWVLCIQCRGAWRPIFAESSHKYSETDFNPSGELRKLIIPTEEPKAAFYASPEIIDSVLLMWDIRFTTINLTNYKNSMLKEFRHTVDTIERI